MALPTISPTGPDSSQSRGSLNPHRNDLEWLDGETEPVGQQRQRIPFLLHKIAIPRRLRVEKRNSNVHAAGSSRNFEEA